jgi:hypothetical protein
MLKLWKALLSNLLGGLSVTMLQSPLVGTFYQAKQQITHLLPTTPS